MAAEGRVSEEEKMTAYGLYQQATVGDAKNGKCCEDDCMKDMK